MNKASFNIANFLGTSIEGAIIDAGIGLIPTVWDRFVLVSSRLLLFAIVFLLEIYSLKNKLLGILFFFFKILAVVFILPQPEILLGGFHWDKDGS